jgi:hypothetical protein
LEFELEGERGMTAGVLFSLDGSIGGEAADSRVGMFIGADMVLGFLIRLLRTLSAVFKRAFTVIP